MRKGIYVGLFCLLCVLCPAVFGQAVAPVVQPLPVRAPESNFTIAERGQNHRVWSGTVEDKLPGGKTRQRPREIVEVASGMYRFDGQTWIETSDQIELNNAD